jgi:DNA polymerase elongation subunit (family B)
MTEDKRFQFMNSYYVREQYDVSGAKPKKTRDDAMVIVYKDSGVSKLQIIDNPKFSFYVSKPDKLETRYVDYKPLTDVDEVTIYYKDLAKFLAEYNNKAEEYYRIRRTAYSNWSERRNAQNQFLSVCNLNPNLFGSDVDINDYYKMEFVRRYGVNIGNYKKAFFDIENIGNGNQFNPTGPVTVDSIYDMDSNTMYVLILKAESEFPTQKAFMERVENGEFVKRLRSDPEMNGEFEKSRGKKPRISNTGTDFRFEFFDSEFDLICRHFKIVNDMKPDFMLAYNFSYDNLYLINRLKMAILDRQISTPLVDLISHTDIPPDIRSWGFEEDRSKRAQFYNKWHNFYIIGYTTYLCSMSMYTNIRKSEGVLPSHALNDIAYGELEKGKQDYSDIADSPIDLPYKDYELYILYNIKDVWLLADMEAKNHDVEAIVYMAEYISLNMVTKPTAVLKNALELFYERQGVALANNRNMIVNRGKTGDVKEYEGAIVAEPRLNKPMVNPLFPFPTRSVRPFVIDSDLASMYPSNAIAYNIYKTTLLFEVKKIGSVLGGPEPADGVIDVCECFDNYITKTPLNFGKDYFQLPSLTELVLGLKTELDNEASRRRKTV